MQYWWRHLSVSLKRKCLGDTKVIPALRNSARFYAGRSCAVCGPDLSILAFVCDTPAYGYAENFSGGMELDEKRSTPWSAAEAAAKAAGANHKFRLRVGMPATNSMGRSPARSPGRNASRRVAALLAFCSLALCGAAFAQEKPQSDSLKPAATRIEADQDADVIRFIVNNREEMRLDSEGLHVRGNIEYSGVIADTGTYRDSDHPGMQRGKDEK